MEPTTGHTPSTDAPEIRVRIPHHVVYRLFVTETVILNLDTGEYHELEHRAGRLLEALEGNRSVASAAAALADEDGDSAEELEARCVELCERLARRGLLELRAADA